MGEIAEFERRITVALERIGTGINRLADPLSPPSAPTSAESASDESASDEQAALREALAEEKTANAQLNERLRAVKEQDAAKVAEHEARIEAMTRQIEAQGLETKRLRRASIQLRENLRALRSAQAESLADPHLINRAMLSELEALRATRNSETAEMDEILAQLAPLLQQDGQDA